MFHTHSYRLVWSANWRSLCSIVAVQGLGGNGFGSWRATSNADMWLRDFLPEKAKNSRILIYGYNADLTGPGAKSFASILDMAKGLVNNLKLARSQPNVSKGLYLKCSSGRPAG